MDENESAVIDMQPDEKNSGQQKNMVKPFHLDNETLGGIVEVFMADSQAVVSAFLRKKITIQFHSLTTCLFDEIEHDYSKMLMLSYQISPNDLLGLITFDFGFLHGAINLLYGGTTKEQESIITGLGKSGLRIAKKIAEMFSIALRDAMEEFLRMNISLSNISNQLSAVFKRHKYDKCFNMIFTVEIESKICYISVVLPVKVIPSANYSDLSESGKMVEEALIASEEDEHLLDEKTKAQLIDSRVSVSVQLPNISLKLKDVVSLKAGDIIPIGDPTQVNLALNGKILFKASLGQTNLQKAIKILERM